MRKQPFYNWFNLLLVWTLPPAEILVGLLLIFERTRLAGLQATLGIMMTFSLYIFAILFTPAREGTLFLRWNYSAAGLGRPFAI